MSQLREDNPDRACSVCGCTWHKACLDPETGFGCHWVGPHLCNVCQRNSLKQAICVSCATDNQEKGKQQ